METMEIVINHKTVDFVSYIMPVIDPLDKFMKRERESRLFKTELNGRSARDMIDLNIFIIRLFIVFCIHNEQQGNVTF